MPRLDELFAPSARRRRAGAAVIIAGCSLVIALGCRANPHYCAGMPEHSCDQPADSAGLDTSSDGSGADGSSAYRPTAVSFSRANGNYLSMGALNGATSVSQRQGTFSVWLRFTANDGDVQDFMVATNTAGLMAGITRTTTNQLQVNAPTCVDLSALVMSTQNMYTIQSGWIHVLAAWDLAAGSASIYVNGTLDTASSPTVINRDICYTAPQWGVGGLTAPELDADVADLYLLLGTYLDISLPATRQKFIDTNGKPVDLGTSCANPTGAPPMSCLHGPLATWNVNVGTGSGMSVNGPALTTASTNPAD
jgi:hypothetical protein